MTHVEQSVLTLPEHLASPWLLLGFMFSFHFSVYQFCIVPPVVLLDYDIGILLIFVIIIPWFRKHDNTVHQGRSLV